MQVVVTVLAEQEAPPPGAAVRVEVRDVSLADAPAEVVASAADTVGASPADVVARVVCDLDGAPPMAAVWVHVDVDGDGRVSVGDFITTQSFPVPPDGGDMTVTVRRI